MRRLVPAPGAHTFAGMKHLTRDEVAMQQLMRRARTIAVIGASPRPERHSHGVCSYLHEQGYDVIPVRPDRAQIAGLPPSYARLADVPGAVDLIVIFRSAAAVPRHIREAAHKRPEAIWLPPGLSSRDAEEEAARLGLVLVEDACIEEEHRHARRGSGHPRKLGVHLGRRKPLYEDNRKHPAQTGYVAGGGGGHAGGGGVRAALDEKKMVAGRPSPRKGPLKAPVARRLHGRRRAKRGAG
jgi:predicted CoA-binding protein